MITGPQKNHPLEHHGPSVLSQFLLRGCKAIQIRIQNCHLEIMSAEQVNNVLLITISEKVVERDLP